MKIDATHHQFLRRLPTRMPLNNGTDDSEVLVSIKEKNETRRKNKSS